jgi:hypothetical protein
LIAFVGREITPRFPDDLSIDGLGQWRDPERITIC